LTAKHDNPRDKSAVGRYGAALSQVKSLGAKAMRRTLLTAPAMIGVGLLLYGCHWLPSHKPVPEPVQLASGAKVGQRAPDLDGEDMAGERLHLADYKGQVVVLNFWANW
jgi:cytochrome oxidase Cu insertion factor (SCO1/SenC/PrrC family)